MTEKHVSLDDTLKSFTASDLIPHSRLMEIADRAWQRLPVADRAHSQAVEKWRAQIYILCKPSLDAAALSLKERNSDEPSLLATKLVLLKESFVRQVGQAMRDLSERDQNKRNHFKAMASINAMIKEIDRASR